MIHQKMHFCSVQNQDWHYRKPTNDAMRIVRKRDGTINSPSSDTSAKYETQES